MEELWFSVTAIDTGTNPRGVGIRTSPPYKGVIINRFMHNFQSLENVEAALSRVRTVYDSDLSNDNVNIGNNDYSIDVKQDYVTFDLLWDKSDDPYEKFYPLKIETREFISFFEALKGFIIRYESCEVPGIIPSSKLDAWVCVPKSAVKDEYRKDHGI